MEETIEKLATLNFEQYMSLDRQWIRAARVRSHFYSLLKQEGLIESLNKAPEKFYVSDLGIYMLLWYALLFSVIEGLKSSTEKTNLTFLDTEYNKFYKYLKGARNCVFHIPPTYFDKRIDKFMTQPNSVDRINHIHIEVGKMLDKARDKRSREKEDA